MICVRCRERQHDDCVNLKTDALIKRKEPIKSCACQHEKNWNFVVKDRNGNGS